MKIFYYCQHVWGVGHFFRSLEICRALAEHEIILVTGGSRVNSALPNHVREVRLPAIMTDRNYTRLFTPAKGKTYNQVSEERQQLLTAYFKKETPDLFIVELYPFGRKAFRFELDPILKGIRQGSLPPCRVVCSLRDILVEKKDPKAYESRVINTLNQYFDALLIHADPGLVKLDVTFSRTADIAVPVVYTGFVTSKPAPGAGQKLRRRLEIKADEVLVVASAGGGKAGAVLLDAVIKSFQLLPAVSAHHLHVFTGPYLNEADFEHLQSLAHNRIKVFRFTSDFLAYLATANLSVSMAGYNTSMNLLATQTPALVLPFSQDREQGLRARRLARLGALQVLENDDLDPSRLCAIMETALIQGPPALIPIDLNGAQNTAEWIENWIFPD
ncbi:glycosyltransferase family protein [Thermodesulfobacteriota bacterium]